MPRCLQLIADANRAEADTALRLARYFGMTPQFWLGLQMDYDLDVASDQLANRIEKEVIVHEVAS